MQRHWFVIEREQKLQDMGSELLDMLRYEGAVVESNAPGGFYLFSKPGNMAPPCVDRWRSFNIDVFYITKQLSPPSEASVNYVVAHLKQVRGL